MPLTDQFTFKADSSFSHELWNKLLTASGIKQRYWPATRMLLAGIIIADLTSATGHASYSRRQVDYARPKGTARALLTYQGMLQGVRALEEAGLVSNVVARPWPEGKGKRSILSLTLAGAEYVYCKEWFEALASVHVGRPDLVVVRDRKTKATIEPPCLALLKHYETRMARINRHIATAQISVPPRFVRAMTASGRIMAIVNPAKPGHGPVVLSPNHKRRLYMPFLSDFEHGGRLVGWDAQIIPRGVRLHCQLNGEAVAEVDLTGSHIAIGYCLAGRPSPETDPYMETAHALGIDRSVVKRAALIALNSGTFFQARASLARYLAHTGNGDFDCNDYTILLQQAASVLLAFRDAHKPISDLFFSDFGIRAQCHEARIMLKVLEGAMQRRFQIVPLHDGALCPIQHAEVVKGLLRAAWFTEFGQKAPNIEVTMKEDRKEGRTVPMCGTIYRHER